MKTLSPMSSSAVSLFAASTNGPVMSIPLTLQPKREIDGGREPTRVEVVDRRQILNGQRIQRLRRSLQRRDDKTINVPVGPMLRDGGFRIHARQSPCACWA